MWKFGGRQEKANKVGAVLSKYAKEIAVAAKLGGADMNANARLRAAVEAARKVSMSRETIERNIKKGAGLLDEKMEYETVFYEGFTPHKVPVIVECLTDNKNRTAADVRVLFRKGQLGSGGSVTWMFDRVGIVEANHKEKKDIEEAAIEAGAQNVEALEKADMGEGASGGRFFTEVTDLDAVGKALTAMGWNITTSEISYIAKNMMDISEDQRKEVTEFLGAIDDHDDVHRIYTAIK